MTDNFEKDINVPSKQIMIDGVDVSGCERHCSDNRNNPNMCYSEMTRTYSNCNPKEKQCNFYITSIEKQLKRKEQECEELKIYIESNEQQVKEVETLVMDNDRLINELDQLRAENDEWKKTINEAQNSGLDLKSFLVCEAVQNEYEQQLDQLKAELEQYKKSKQASYEALQKKCNELELEKRKLKERLDQWISKCEQETKLKEFHKNETDEYKNTLLYIKEIAEVQQSWNEVNRQSSETEFEDDIFAYNWSALKQILNKISEVLKR